MKRSVADNILYLVDVYENTDRGIIVKNLGTVLDQKEVSKPIIAEAIGISRRMIYRWFDDALDVKPALIRLCKSAEYLGVNILWLLGANELDIETFDDLAALYIEGYDLQYNTGKCIVLDNLELYLGKSETLAAQRSSLRRLTLESITGANRNTINAWMNRSRLNVKIPLVSLCKLAKYLDVDVLDLMKKK